jgi:4-hydroxythreonine-4-phosphate dehydrogenase
MREYDQTLSKNHKQGELTFLPVTCPAKILPGRPDPNYASYITHCLDLAIDGCLEGEFSAMVTGPVNKAVINQAGTYFIGHTEYVADRCNNAFPVMMLMNGTFRVALVTTHLPLSRVPETINQDLLKKVLLTVHTDMKQKFGINSPELLVCGLNPHAGEQGYLGNEEQLIIEPVISHLNSKGLYITGPISADTAFTTVNIKQYDAIICMYHDQGLPVLKSSGFGNIVNVTMGLPIIRTSVDHGTAYDLAGTGKADVSSLFAAINCAFNLADNVKQRSNNRN